MDFIDHYRVVAHRGLHNNAGGIPENSLLAFQRTVEKGTAIELDVHLTADGQLVIFHDNELKRMTGVPGMLEEWTLADLKKLHLLDTDCTIPTLDEVLELVSGQVPLLIEIKNDNPRHVGNLEPVLMEKLQAYQGEFILESFNPEVLIWLKRHAPQYIRGQLGNLDGEKGYFQFFCKHLMMNPLTKPQFVAFDIHEIDYKLRIACKKRGIPLFAWTVTTQEELKKANQLCDGVIFEKLDL